MKEKEQGIRKRIKYTSYVNDLDAFMYYLNVL